MQTNERGVKEGEPTVRAIDISEPVIDSLTLVRTFQSSEIFDRLYKEMWNLVDGSRNLREIKKWRGRFRGGLFQGMAYLYVLNSLPPNEFSLSFDEIRAVYKELFPDAEDMEDPFEQSSLAGVTVPDGLVKKRENGRERYVRVCEFTLDSSSVSSKYEAFKIHKKKFRDQFRGAQLLLVVPEDCEIPVRIAEDADVDVRPLPLTRVEFYEYDDYIYSSYRNNPFAETLEELQWMVLLEPRPRVQHEK